MVASPAAMPSVLASDSLAGCNGRTTSERLDHLAVARGQAADHRARASVQRDDEAAVMGAIPPPAQRSFADLGGDAVPLVRSSSL